MNANARVDAVLSVGQLSESVTVTADATGVDTRSSTMGEVVDRIRVQELPLSGRNIVELARLVPGVIGVSAPAAVTQSGAVLRSRWPAAGIPRTNSGLMAQRKRI